MRIIILAHSSLAASHPGKRKMYDSVRREFDWPHMVSSVYIVVNNCTEFPRMGTKFSHHRKLELFPPDGPLELVAIDILGPLPGIKADRHFIFIVTDRYTKIARAIPTKIVTSTEVTNIFFNDWIVPSRPPNTVLSDNGQ